MHFVRYTHCAGRVFNAPLAKALCLLMTVSSVNRVSCRECGASILPSTSEKCSGSCMRCFMEANDGYRPSEIEYLQKRGLEEFRLKWKRFYENAFSSRISSISDEQLKLLTSSASIIIAEVNGFLRFGNGRFQASSGTEKMLLELESIDSSKVKKYIDQVRSFHEVLRRKT